MRRRRGTIWNAFLVAACAISIVSVFVSIAISQRSVAIVEDRLCSTNLSRAEQIGENFQQLIDQINRLAVGISVSDDVNLFFQSDNPQNLFDRFYTRIKNLLSSYAFSMRDTTSAVMLYSPQYNRFMSDDISSQYTPDGSKTDLTYNAEWTQSLTPVSTGRSNVSFLLRATNNSYPYVMTLIHQMSYDGYESVVAFDIDLKKVYSVLCSDIDKNTSVWILDKGGRVIIEQSKHSLLRPSSDYPLPDSFEKNETDASILLKKREQAVVFSQKYLEDLQVYVVVATQIIDLTGLTAAGNLNTFLIAVACTLLLIIFIYLYTRYTTKPMWQILTMLQNPNTATSYRHDREPSVQEAADYIVTYMQTNGALEVELDKRMSSLRDTQLQALKAQINPHFLFNTLNIITTLLDDGKTNPQALKVTINLSDILRFALKDEHIVSLHEELANARKYIEILEIRYCGKFHTRYEIDETLLDVKIPRLVLQPIVENAVFHGISAKERGNYNCELSINCKSIQCETAEGSRDFICIEVSDNGVGMSQEKVDALMESFDDEAIHMSNIGIRNVARRLRLLYLKDGKLSIQSVLGKGTTVTLTFPYSKNAIEDAEKRSANERLY